MSIADFFFWWLIAACVLGPFFGAMFWVGGAADDMDQQARRLVEDSGHVTFHDDRGSTL